MGYNTFFTWANAGYNYGSLSEKSIFMALHIIALLIGLGSLRRYYTSMQARPLSNRFFVFFVLAHYLLADIAVLYLGYDIRYRFQSNLCIAVNFRNNFTV